MPDTPQSTPTNILPFRTINLQNQTDIILRAEDIRLTRDGRPLINGLGFSIEQTGITTLLGPNGAGKSLILRLIAGLITADSGKLSIEPSLSNNLALVFQTPVVLRRSVKANLDHALKIYGVPKKERLGRIAELLVMADLTTLAEAPARTLSGGEKQRLAMARALAARPKLLLLDEPTASLDPHATAAIERLTRSASASGVKIILVTHDRGQAERMADDVLFVHRGRATEHSKADLFFKTPASEEGQTYLNGQILL